MNEKKINIPLTREVLEADDIINDILEYAKLQYDNKVLNPSYYADVLLFIAELLPYLDNKEEWMCIGYNICKDIKYNLEEYGFENSSGMFNGVGYKCFAVERFSENSESLKGFSRSMKEMLFLALDEKLDKIKNVDTCDFFYDVISGVSGTLYYLLDCVIDLREENIVSKGLEYLVTLSADKIYRNQALINFHVKFENQNKLFDRNRFREGSVN